MSKSTNIAVIGAGPYGLSIGAYLRDCGVEHRIFGRPMDSWAAHMPKGMCLKSDGFASNLYDPRGEFTLSRYCAGRGIQYADVGLPVRLDTFCAYGLEFQKHMAPGLEDKTVTSLRRAPGGLGGFELCLNTGETFTARRVILAVGITHFEYTPPVLASLPPELLSHSFHHHKLEKFRGRSIAVIGGGSSALDLAGLLHEQGTNVCLISRRASLNFHSEPLKARRPLWQRIRHPQSGLGPGIRARFYADLPGVFHHLPESLRLKIVRTTLGPSGGWFVRSKVVGRVPLLLGSNLERVSTKGGKAHLQLRNGKGSPKEVVADHVVAATGYRVNLALLPFLDAGLRADIETVSGSPALSTTFESSVAGLYFAGLSAANSFGPVMRFAFGAGFTARTLAQAVAHRGASVAAPAEIHEAEPVAN